MLRELTITSEFRDWQWELTQRLREAIESIYATTPDEVNCISAMVGAIDRSSTIGSPQAPRIRVNIESALLHGSRSQVKFSVGGIEKQRELADLLVLGSFVEKGSLRWQRVCFIQAKRENSATKRSAARFNVDAWQLALLRTFPKFTGVSGIFKGQNLRLRNQSGMLGGYGLLSAPGDFSIISARVLHLILGGRKSFTGKELVPAILSESRDKSRGSETVLPWWPIDPDHCPECRELVEYFWGRPWRHWSRYHRHHHSKGAFHYDQLGREGGESRLTCLGLDEFVDAWTSLQLGEIWHTDSTMQGDLALRDCIDTLVSRVVSSTGSLKSLNKLITASTDSEPPHRRERNNVLYEEPEGGLAILSATATTGGEG